MHIAALATCHNRRDATCASLADLFSQQLPPGVTLAVTIVDDGSSDGTGEAVQRLFPSVRIVAGDGNLFWAGGMRHGWATSVKGQAFDHLLAYNDDIRLKPDAIGHLLEVASYGRRTCGPLTVVSGVFTDDSGTRITYGGYRRRPGWHRLRFDEVQPSGVPVQIDTLNMNCALISRESLDAVGFLADHFHHCGADLDYGLRVRRAGGSIWLTGKAIGTCQDRPNPLKTQADMSFRERVRVMTGPQGQSLWERARYCREHGGPLWPLMWAGPFMRAFAMGLVPGAAARRTESRQEIAREP